MKLYMDHFYRVLSQEAFEEAKQLLEIFPGSTHKKQQSGDLFWEGIYLYSKCGIYLELLREDSYWKTNMQGIAFSQIGDEHNLHETLQVKYPGFSWKFREVKRNLVEPWFKSTMLDIPEFPLFLWAMEYQDGARERRKQAGKEKTNIIGSIDKLEICVASDLFEKLPEYLGWISQVAKDSREQIIFSIPKKESSPFKLIVNNGDKLNHSFSIVLTLNADTPASVKLSELKHIECKQTGLNLNINFRL